MLRILLVGLFFVCSYVKADTLTVENKISYQVDFAKEKKDLLKGLMFVRNLPENRGMLFDFRKYDNPSMWMKNTYIALDMIFIDCDFKIVDVYKNAKPMSLDEIKSKENFCYVLEINGGMFDKHGLAIGDRFIFRY